MLELLEMTFKATRPEESVQSVSEEFTTVAVMEFPFVSVTLLLVIFRPLGLNTTGALGLDMLIKYPLPSVANCEPVM
jgi:hypothetical protein